MTSYEWTLVAHEHGPDIICPHGCELCETCGDPVKMMSQHMSGYCSPRCEAALASKHKFVDDWPFGGIS